ncbi:MAG: SGNH/GDSL hydrolase family protein [Planctomycetota bacterium]
MGDQQGRREFLTAGVLAAGAAAIPNASGATPAVEPDAPRLIPKGATVLFQGDSITDAGRNRELAGPNDAASLGSGYAFLAATNLLVHRAEDALKLFNRGISGNKVFQLAERWQQDCLDLKPDVLSILIGVNDLWHVLAGKYDGTLETYRDYYRRLLDRTKTALPDVKLVICEPFVLKVGAVDDTWFPAFDEHRAVAKQIADDYADAWVPFQSVFDRALTVAPPATWAGDGVHPSQAGATLMASAWLRAVGE